MGFSPARMKNSPCIDIINQPGIINWRFTGVVVGQNTRFKSLL